MWIITPVATESAVLAGTLVTPPSRWSSMSPQESCASLDGGANAVIRDRHALRVDRHSLITDELDDPEAAVSLA